MDSEVGVSVNVFPSLSPQHWIIGHSGHPLTPTHTPLLHRSFLKDLVVYYGDQTFFVFVKDRTMSWVSECIRKPNPKIMEVVKGFSTMVQKFQ